MPSFNLVHETWIPVLTSTGRLEEVSLQDLFRRAADLAAIEDGNPLTVAALHRLLLAIIHRSLDGPKSISEWRDLWSRGSFEGAPIATYLDRWQERFDLFSESAPFMQTAGFRTDTEAPITKLAVERAAKNNKTLFDHSLDDAVVPFPAPLAARTLITAQAFALAAGKSAGSEQFGDHPYSRDAPLASGAVILLLGSNLFETLCLNTLKYTGDAPVPRTGDDRPAWEDDRIRRPVDRLPEGYLDYLTWTSRHIRLLPEAGGGCPTVRTMYFSQGQWVTPEMVEDPMFAYRIRMKDEKRLFIRIDPNRAPWRDADSLFYFQGRDVLRPHAFRQAGALAKLDVVPRARKLRCCVIGLASDQANPILWRGEQLPVPMAALAEPEVAVMVQRAVQFGERAAGEVRKAGVVLAASILPLKPIPKAVGNAVKSLRVMETYWAGLDLPFRRFLHDLGDGEEEALRSWRKVVAVVARRALSDASDNCAGRTARELQARVRAEQTLMVGLARLQQEEGV